VSHAGTSATTLADPPVQAPAPDGRESRSLSSDENLDLCSGCVTCCTYVTIEVDAPRQAWEYDQWIWMLHHQSLEMYVERPERWFVYIPTRCRQLNTEGRCTIHGRHPVLCRDYDPRSCERRYPLSDMRGWFHNAEELEAWIQQHRPAHWTRLLAYRSQMPAGPPKARGVRTAAGVALVQIEGMGAGAQRGPGARARSVQTDANADTRRRRARTPRSLERR
jgi:hypothetical protein